MLIDQTSTAATESSETTWRDALANTKTLLAAIDKAIYELSQNNIRSYTINTGQDVQTVTRADLASLFARRTALLQQIAILEARLGIGKHKQVRQIVPGF
ncbi:MAG: hypothetical protein IJ191_09180 [Treponema sp.]|nr:hypothetical protein [Treponema sp.]